MTQHEINNPFLFACGVPRSGTTLLQRMLNAHPELAVANDSHFIPRALELTDKTLLEKAASGAAIPLTSKLVDNVRNYHRFYRMGLDDDEFEEVRIQSETYQQLVAGLYGRFAEKSDKRLGGEKTPDYLRRLNLLHGLFPSAKLIHLVRDGRNVALSLLQWAKPNKGPGRIGLWNENPMAVCALWWRWLVLASRQQVATVDPEFYCEVNYENMVSDPEKSMRSVCDFLQLEYREQMIQYHHGKSRQQSKLSAKSAWLAPQQGIRDWKTHMNPQDVELFEALAADALEEFGFEVRHAKFSSQTETTAEYCNGWWRDNFLRKHESAENTPAPQTDDRIQSETTRPNRTQIKGTC